MLLAELEVWHSRPYAPTRRVALGHLVLPADPAPGFGGILLAAVVAVHIDRVDPDLVPDLHRLVNEVDRGQRIVQPRLRHRYQVDRHGLARSRHRMVGDGEQAGFEFDDKGTPLQQVLGAVYAAERLASPARHAVATALHQAMRWRGPLGAGFIASVTGASTAQASSYRALVDPVAWALEVLGFEPGTVKPPKREVMARYRARLREVHPDHGGEEREASQRIGDLSEARRVLVGD